MKIILHHEAPVAFEQTRYPCRFNKRLCITKFYLSCDSAKVIHCTNMWYVQQN